MTVSKRAVLTLAALLLLVMPTAAQAEGFGFVPGSVTMTPLRSDGTVENQAGAHPYEFVVNFNMNTEGPAATPAGGSLKQVLIELPPGFVGNLEAVPTCGRLEFEGPQPHCSGDTQIGILRANVYGLGTTTSPLYNVAPPSGLPAKFGYSLFEKTVFQEASVDSARGYGVTVGSTVPIGITEASATVWGVPSEGAHDADRVCGAVNEILEHGCSAGQSHPAFLTMPTACGPFQGTITAYSKEVPVQATETVRIRNGAGVEEPLVGCDSVPFSPEVNAQPTTSAAESASGLGFKLSLPDKGLLGPDAVAETEPQTTEVIFPQGISVNPSAANGIAGCSAAEYAEANGEPGVGCPEASKIGTIVAQTPLLGEAIEGSVYLARPHENPFDSLLAVYIVARAKERGILVKQAGKAEADAATGQLRTTFAGLPPVPYSSFEVRLREGPRAPLVTPQTCGSFTTQVRLYPFSNPDVATERTPPFTISSGAGGGSCASSESQLPAHPTLEAGSTTPLAGAYSPFVFRLKRSDGEQRISAVSAIPPAGLLGRIAGIPYCSDAAIALAASRTNEGEGALENASPSCPSASQVGVVNVAAGAGSQPYYVQGKAYLAGPYKGAPLSIEIITPAIAGPFDLGSVAVRTALYVNEVTAQIHAVSDPLPTILHGIPLALRVVSLQLNRKEFSLNPTNCQAKSVTGSITTVAGLTAGVSNPFAVAGCSGLAFKPELKLSFSGQTKRTGFPAIKAVLTQPKGQNANLAGATVILPKGMLIANAHINNPCTRVQFNSGPLPGDGCSKKSILGTAKLWTPLLDKPEIGKVYFRSNGGERELPDMVVALRGTVPVQLLGFIDSVGRKNAEVRRVRSRFLNVPDAPVSRFELKLDGGKKGLLQNSKNLCKVGNRAKIKLDGQNGKSYDTEPKIQVSCGKKGNGKKKS